MRLQTLAALPIGSATRVMVGLFFLPSRPPIADDQKMSAAERRRPQGIAAMAAAAAMG